MMKHLCCVGIVCLIVWAAAAWQAQAQVTTATFYGLVTDPSGAVIPNASVSLKNEQTGIATATKTDALGEFGLTFLRVGVLL
jgi:hypothetical protein